MALKTGDLLSQRYRIGQIIAQSDAGSLYHAQDKVSGTDVLVNEIRAGEPGSQATGVDLDTLLGLQHPNLLKVSDHFALGQEAYLIFDGVGLVSLQQRLKVSGPLPYSEAVPLLLNLSDGLLFLHNQAPPLAHGKIGLETIFTAPTGQVFLLYSGSKPGADVSADVYDLGKAAFTMMTNLAPEPTVGEDYQAGAAARLQKEFPGIPESIGRVIAQASDPQPERRFSNSEDFKAGLLYALVQIPPETLRASPLSLPAAEPAVTDGIDSAASLPPAQAAPPPAPPEPTTPIRRRVPWGLL